jgi:hypothetical protein
MVRRACPVPRHGRSPLIAQQLDALARLERLVSQPLQLGDVVDIWIWLRGSKQREFFSCSS